jgi:NitT/TauT family transport system substrate-binding protein
MLSLRLGTIFAVMLCATGPSLGQSVDNTKLTPVNLNLSWVPTTANQLPFFLAKARGYFKSEGLDVTLVPGRGSSLTAQTVGSGQYDMAQADLTTMAVVRSKGAPLKAVMVQFPRTSSGIVASTQAGINSWADLLGKNLGLTHGGAETYLLPAVFKKLGLDLDKVKQINTPAAGKNTAYLSNLVDAISTDAASEMPLLNPQRAATPLWYGDVLEVPYHGLFAREDVIKSKPNVVGGVTRATIRATQAMANDPKVTEEAARAMLAANPAGSLDPANLVAAWKLYARFQTSHLTEGLPLGSMSRAGWQQTLNLLRDYASFSGSMNPDDYFTNEFISK